MDFIFIHGAPGTGKSSLAWALQAQFQSFEVTYCVVEERNAVTV